MPAKAKELEKRCEPAEFLIRKGKRTKRSCEKAWFQKSGETPRYAERYPLGRRKTFTQLRVLGKGMLAKTERLSCTLETSRW